MILAGCSVKPTVPTGPAPKPFAGVSLTVSCPDPALAKVLGPAARSWGTKSGATVAMSGEKNADVVVLRPVDFGIAAAAGQLRPLPPSLRDPGHPFNLTGIPDVFSEGVAGWAGRPTGIVLAADAAVLVYRKDRFENQDARNTFRTKFQRDLTPPTSWEDTATVAEFFREKDGKPSLPPLPTDPDKLLDFFHRVAACTDRPAVTPSNVAGRKLNDRSFAAEAVSFHFRYDTGAPRLDSPGFAMAVELLARMQPSRMTAGPDDPVAALDSGAVLAVCTLADVARLPKGSDGAVEPRFGIAKLPGTKRYYDALAKAVTTVSGNEANAVPFFSGGWVGAVSTGCTAPGAAFDLLAELGGPTGAGAIVGEPAVGSGPWRGSLIEAGKRSLWYAYGFSPTETDALLRALKPYVSSDLRNPAVAPRGPGLEPLLKSLEGHVRAAILGKEKPADAMNAAQADWLRLERANGPDVPKWRKADMRGE